jgi:hypothetical protein
VIVTPVVGIKGVIAEVVEGVAVKILRRAREASENCTPASVLSIMPFSEYMGREAFI